MQNKSCCQNFLKLYEKSVRSTKVSQSLTSPNQHGCSQTGPRVAYWLFQCKTIEPLDLLLVNCWPTVKPQLPERFSWELFFNSTKKSNKSARLPGIFGDAYTNFCKSRSLHGACLQFENTLPQEMKVSICS